ncbi:MAG: glycosyltransferase family 39 protein [Chloroflexi bacterium]|nr:glycosyltransferase family 39 protein [Chloroflexota bacterium]
MNKSLPYAQNRQKQISIILVLIALGGVIIMWVSTPWGIGVGYDSVFYLSAADNFLNGSGLSRFDGYGNIIPLTHFPPLYPLILAALSFITGAPTDIGARWLSVVFFGVNIYLMGWLVYRYTSSMLAGVLFSLAAFMSPILVDIHLMAMTEPLYLILMLLTLHSLYNHIETKQLSHLILAAAMAALAYLTRYVGLTLVATGGLLILIWGRHEFWRRVKDAFLFGVIGVAPIVVWYARNLRVAGTVSNRTMVFHPPTMQKIIGGISTISQWFFPGVVSGQWRTVGLVLGLLIFSVLLVIWLLHLRKLAPDHTEKTAAQFVAVLALYLVVYLAMLAASLTVFDASTRLNDRILSPVYVLLILVIVIMVWQLSTNPPWKVLKYGFVGVLLFWIGASAFSTNQIYSEMQRDGKGFNERKWQTSETIASINNLHPQALIFSNEAFPIYYLTGRPANWIPEKRDVVKQQASQDYMVNVAKMQQSIKKEDGYLVVFDTIEKHWVYPSLEEMSTGLVLYADFEDGVIYAAP